MSTIPIFGTLAPNVGSSLPLASALYISQTCAVVADSTERDTVLSGVKGSKFVCFRLDTKNFEYWNGSAWTVVAGGAGGGRSAPFTLSSSTTDADPGNGTLRISTASYATAGSWTVYIDLLDANAVDQTSWFDSFDDNIGTPKGVLRLQSKSDPTKAVEAVVTAITAATGYRKISCTYLDGPGGLPTLAGDVSVSFDAYGVPQNLNNQALTNARTISYASEVDNATSTLDFTTGALQKKTLAANTTLATPTPPPAFAPVQARFIQAASGGPFTLAFWAGIVWTGAVPVMPTGASAELIVSGYHDGTTWRLAGRVAVADGVEYDAAGNLRVSSQLPARGTCNTAVDLIPSGQPKGTVNTGSSVTADVPLVSGKRYVITCDAQVDDGSGVTQYLKALSVRAQNRGGTCEILSQVVITEVFFAGAVYTLTAAISTTNVRFTLANTSGTNRPYNLIIGVIALDKP